MLHSLVVLRVRGNIPPLETLEASCHLFATLKLLVIKLSGAASSCPALSVSRGDFLHLLENS